MGQPSVDFKDFDGGISDHYIDARPNQAQAMDNLLITKNRKPVTRPGTNIYDSVMYQLPSGNSRVGSLPRLERDTLFFQNQRNLYYQDSTWQTLLGPSSNPAFPYGTTSSFASFAEWNKHLFLTNDLFGSPIKVYRDADGDLQVRTAGLPHPAQLLNITLINAIKTAFNLHIYDLDEHSATDPDNEILSPDAYDNASFSTLLTELVEKLNDHIADSNLSSGRVQHPGQAATNLLAPQISAYGASSTVGIQQYLAAVKTSYNSHDAESTAHANQSENQVSADNYIAGSFTESGGSVEQYQYFFVLAYEYYVNDVFFVDLSPPYKFVKSTTANAATACSFSNIPVLSNGTIGNYDTANLKWYVYKTAANGTVPYFYQNPVLLHGSTTWNDTFPASPVPSAQNEPNFPKVYTLGGIKDNDPPPPSKYLIVIDDIAWYGHVNEYGNIRTNRIRQSQKFDPDSCPESFYIDVDDEIVGLGTFNSYLIAVCKDRVYRIEGFKDELGQGTIQKKEIGRGVGGVNHLSIINTDKGCFFAGSKGFFWTDGFKVQCITEINLDITYPTLVANENRKNKIYGAYDADQNRIYWAVSNSGNENTQIWVLDLSRPIMPEAVFTKIIPSDDTWIPTCLAFDTEKNLVIGDTRGYIFKFDDNAFADPKIDTSTTPDNWEETAIEYDYISSGQNYGDANNLKIATNLTIIADAVTPLSMQPQRQRDNSSVWKDLAEIRDRSSFLWLDALAPAWGSADMPNWRNFPFIKEKRRFPKDGLRFLYLQIRFKNSLTVLYRSDDYGTGTVALVSDITKSLTLTGSLTWPTDIVDYFITFDAIPNRRFLITQRVSGTVIYFRDSGNQATTGTLKEWEVIGTKKKERFNLNSYSVEYQPAASSHGQYRGVTGGNE